MDKKLENKVETLVKSMYKSVKKARKKNAIDDLFDSNRVAEMNPDDIPSSQTGGLMGGNTKKAEEFVSTIVKNMETISKTYLMEKAKVDNLEPSATKRRQNRSNRKEGFTPNKKEKLIGPNEDGKYSTEWKKKPTQSELKSKLKDKSNKRNNKQGKTNTPSHKDLEYPMVASEKC